MGTIRFTELDLSNLRVHPGYQRPLDEGWVIDKQANFDERLLGVLMVSHENGQPVLVWDGQHRLELLRRLGWTRHMCQVSDESPQDQALLFVKGQEGRRNISWPDRHKAKLFGNDPQALEINGLVGSFGYRLGTPDDTGKIIGAVGTFYWIHDKGGTELLRRVMDVITGAWANHSAAFNDRVLRGLAVMLTAYPDLDLNVVIDSFKNESPRALLLDAQARAKYYGSNNHVEFARTLIRIFNKFSGRRLRDPFGKNGRLKSTNKAIARRATAVRKAKLEAQKNGTTETAKVEETAPVTV